MPRLVAWGDESSIGSIILGLLLPTLSVLGYWRMILGILEVLERQV